MDKTQLPQLLQVLLANDQVRLILGLIGADLLLGVAASIRTKTFQLCRLGDFLLTKVLPYLLGYGAVRMVVVVMPEWEPYGNAVWLIVVAALVGDLAGNLQQLGLPLPPALSKPDAAPKG